MAEADNSDRIPIALLAGGLFAEMRHDGFDPQIVNNGNGNQLVITGPDGGRYLLTVASATVITDQDAGPIAAVEFTDLSDIRVHANVNLGVVGANYRVAVTVEPYRPSE